MTPAEKQYNLMKNARFLFWAFLVQTIVFCIARLYFTINEISSWGSLFVLYTYWDILRCMVWLIACVLAITIAIIAINNHYKRKGKWVSNSVIIGYALLGAFIASEAAGFITGNRFDDFVFRYDLFMIDVNLMFIAFLIKYRANASIAEGKAAEGEQLLFTRAVTPKISQILFSIGVYSLCIEIGFACALLIPAKTMAIIGSVLVGIIALIIIAAIFGTSNDDNEYLE